ncbi:hypothetical protein ABIE56_000328 [Luteibacter sp. 621]
MHAPTRMFLRLCLPALAVALLTALFALGAGVFHDVARHHLGHDPLGDALAAAGAAGALLLYWAAVWRFRNWKRGCPACCKDCGCALGPVRDTASGVQQVCLGCGKRVTVRAGDSD